MNDHRLKPGLQHKHLMLSLVLILSLPTVEDLIEIQPSEGSCSFKFPGKPKVVTAANGSTTYLFEDGKGTSYQFVLQKNAQAKGLRGESLERVIDSGRDAILKRLDAKVISEKKFTLDGYPGRDILSEGQSKKGAIRHRVVIANEYVLMFLIVGNARTVNSQQTTTILQSLKLTK